jgi:hypothetical protein
MHLGTCRIRLSGYQLQLSIQWSPQRTPKRPSSEPHGATRQQQAIAKTPAKWSSYQIPSVNNVFVVLVSLPHFQRPQEALNLLVTEERYWALFYMPLYTILHTLLNVLAQIANKMVLTLRFPHYKKQTYNLLARRARNTVHCFSTVVSVTYCLAKNVVLLLD